MGKKIAILEENNETKRRYLRMILDFIDERCASGKEPTFTEINGQFTQLSKGCISNYLKELEEMKKIQSYRDGKKKYYQLGKISLPIKIMVITIVLSVMFSMLLDMLHLFSKEILLYSMIMTVFTSIVTNLLWYKSVAISIT